MILEMIIVLNVLLMKLAVKFLRLNDPQYLNQGYLATVFWFDKIWHVCRNSTVRHRDAGIFTNFLEIVCRDFCKIYILWLVMFSVFILIYFPIGRLMFDKLTGFVIASFFISLSIEFLPCNTMSMQHYVQSLRIPSAPQFLRFLLFMRIPFVAELPNLTG